MARPVKTEHLEANIGKIRWSFVIAIPLFGPLIYRYIKPETNGSAWNPQKARISEPHVVPMRV
jgi:hypothetical protein